jgi:hypothetical protein
MKSSFLLIAMIGALFFSCEKNAADKAPISFEGTWKMIQVKEIASNSMIIKPSDIQGDVILKFIPVGTSAGSFTGNTPTNILATNNYTLGSNQAISIPALGMTKAWETSWGSEFVNNIRDAQYYSLECGRLNIKTTNKVLIFQKQ